MPQRSLLLRWLFAGVIAFGLSLSGPAHSVICHGDHGHDHGSHAHEHDSCCDQEAPTGEAETELAHHHGEHSCPLCGCVMYFGGTVAVVSECCGVEREEAPIAPREPRLTPRPSRETERGPPRVS